MIESPALLTIRDLHAVFRNRVGGPWSGGQRIAAVAGVSLEIPRGTTLGLVGESGCGKSTLSRTILRLVPASGGDVRFDGIDVLAASAGQLRWLRRRMQMVFQDSSGSLDPRLTVGQAVAEPLVIHHLASGNARRRRISELLERVGLSADLAECFPHQLSGGQRQRVGIARALAGEPELLLLDEPVSALDVSIQSQILNLLADLQRDLGLTYLLISHNLAVVRHVSHCIAVMYAGRIVETGAPAAIFANPRHPYTRLLLEAVLSPNPKLGGPAPPAPSEPVVTAVWQGGCAFAPRCSLATQRCRASEPVLEPAPASSLAHRVACFHADSVSPAIARAIGQKKGTDEFGRAGDGFVR